MLYYDVRIQKIAYKYILINVVIYFWVLTAGTFQSLFLCVLHLCSVVG